MKLLVTGVPEKKYKKILKRILVVYILLTFLKEKS